MKKSLIKNNFKSIIKTRRRFLSILIMAFLGVGFYAGLVATSPDMLDSLDRYADNTKMHDINIISTLGLTEEDIEEIQKIEGIENVYGIQTKDSIVEFNDKESICKVIEYNENVNIPVILSGNLPQNSNECLLDKRYSINGNLEEYIGKTIKLQNDDTNEDGTSIFMQKELKVVGIVESPLYISTERGNTSIGNGNIEFFIYVNDDVINMDYYTELCATVKNADKEVTNSEEYLELVDSTIKEIENIKEERQNSRYNQLVNSANNKLEDAQKQYDDKKLEVEQEISNAETKIENAKTEISNSENELKKSESELNTQEKNAEKQFEDAENKIKEAEKEITAKSEELEKGRQEFEKSKAEANALIEKLSESIASTKVIIQELQNTKKQMEQNGLDTTEIDNKIISTQETLNQLEQQKNQIEIEIKNAENKIISSSTELDNARNELEKQKNILEENKQKANKEIKAAKQKILDGKKDIESAKEEITQSENELQEAKTEANNKLQEAQQELDNAKDEINKIEKATWYIQDRLDNIGYTNIFDAIKTMSNISKIFPVIFYIVAVLISLTSMTRMVEEERIEIGTLKSLGYTNIQIISKYILYAFLACIIGGFIGMTVGFYLLPNIVWIIYSTIYQMPEFYVSYQLAIGLKGILFAFACIGGATILVAYKELKEMPASLMRPKPPKNGKKIMLEKLSIIWKRLNFSQKITVRNIFRYKKRAVMTIVGIAGCTGLMLTGFGIRDSITDIPSAQYGEIFKYEMMVSLSDTNNISELKQYLDSNQEIENYTEIHTATGKLKNQSSNYDVTIFVPNKNYEIENVFSLNDVINGEKVNLSDNGIIITDKVAEFLNVKMGDEITLIDSDNIEHKMKIDAITKNYVLHYVYMSQDFYESNIKSYKTNTMLINIKDMNEQTKSRISEEILNISGVASISEVSTLITSIENTLVTMNYVVIILIVASALLAFVVLYNLANINIGERQRELATLKVLGFYDREVDNYINKENIIFTVIGIILGLIFGTFLTNAIIASVEIDKLRFIIRISVWSYLFATILTMSFSIIVNRIIHFILKKIDMIESLKSVE